MSEENLAASEKELSDAVDEALNEATVVVDEVATLTSDLQRLQAEYANYRKRVDRDRVSTTEFAFDDAYYNLYWGAVELAERRERESAEEQQA